MNGRLRTTPGFRACAVEGCGGNAHYSAYGSQGWCRSHYQRWKRHGSTNRATTPAGEPNRYLREVVMAYDGDECLAWPFMRNTAGYGRIAIDGRLQTVSRVVCEEAHGPPPTPEHDAAHSCGNGRLGCVAKRHLSWKTRAENMADTILHGTAARGERHGAAKLSAENVREIRTLYPKLGHKRLASMFGVSVDNIKLIHKGKIWKSLE